MATSLGEAISLQGRNTISEQIGKLSFQANEAQKARVAKTGVDAAETAKLQQKEVLDLFKRTGTMHRLVVPRANEVVTEAFNEMMKIRSSGSPFASNRYAEVLTRAQGEVAKLQAQSQALNDFDNQLRTVDRGKKYFGRGFEEFIPAYQKAERIEQLQQLTKDYPRLSQGLYFNLNPEGIPSVAPTEAIPYRADLSQMAKSMSPIEIKTDIKSPANIYGTRLIKNTKVVPATIEEKNLIAKANGLNPASIKSVEEMVIDYMRINPDVVMQLADKMDLPLEPDVNGNIPEETYSKVKENLIATALPFTKTTQQTMAAYAPRSSGGAGGAADVKIEDLVGSGETLGVNLAGVESKYTSTRNYGVAGNEPALDLTQGNKLTGMGSDKAISGSLTNAKMAGIHILPYWVDNGIKRPIRDGDTDPKRPKAGYHPFILFQTPGQKAWGDIEAYRPQQLISGSAKEWATMAQVQKYMLQEAKNTK